MTLTVALSVKNGMVFATDSRGTIGDPRGLTAQNDTVKKMYILGDQTILQMSGASETGSMIIDEILTKCKAEPSLSTTEIMNKSREILIRQYNEWFRNMPIRPVQNSGQPERPNLNITISGFDNNNTETLHRIYSLNSSTNFAPQLFNTGICLTGVPQYAIYLLHRLFSPEMNVENATSLSAYVITETATQDGKVGGPLQLMCLEDGENVVEINSNDVDRIVEENNTRSKKLRELFFSDGGAK